MIKSDLFEWRLPKDEVEIPGVGTITVRGLSRIEMLHAGRGEPDPETMERRMLAIAMVDPPLTESEAGDWQNISPAGELMPVLAAINRLSGIGRDVQKEAYKSLREESGSGVRVLPSAEAVDDRGPAEGEPVRG
jgi:hypothetical protein